MTDREKLQKAIEILEANIQQVTFVQSDGFHHAIDILKFHQRCISQAYVSGRPCFDKPAGMPILHGETVCSEYTETMPLLMASRQKLTREMTQEERDGWANTGTQFKKAE